MAEKGKFHTIERGDQADDIDELFEAIFKRLGLLDILTTKGDIITYDGTNYVRLARGGDGQVLTSRASATPGLAWEDAASEGTTNVGGERKYWFYGLAYGAL